MKSFVSLPCIRILLVCGANAERSRLWNAESEPKQGRSVVTGKQKLGVPAPEQLKSELESGNYDKVLRT